MSPHTGKVNRRSIRFQISQMGYWGQKAAIGLPVGFVTLAVLGLTATMLSVTAAMYAAGVVAYTGIVFAYAWIDESMYFLSVHDTRSPIVIALPHVCIVGALVAILHLIVRFNPAILPRGRHDFSWPAIAVFCGMILVMYGEIFWLTGGKTGKPKPGSRQSQQHRPRRLRRQRLVERD